MSSHFKKKLNDFNVNVNQRYGSETLANNSAPLQDKNDKKINRVLGAHFIFS